MMVRWTHACYIFGFLILFPGTIAFAQTQTRCDDWVAKIVSIEGRVEMLPAGETTWKPVKLEDTYCPDDRVRTLEKSRAAFILKNETTLRLDENTIIKFSSLKPDNPSLLQLLTGSAFFMSRYPRPLTIETPYVNAASGGTEFNIKVNPDDKSTTITVIEGQMNLSNEAGSAVVKAGQEAVTMAGQSPVVRIPVRPRDAIQWAVYYPPILSLRDLHLEATGGLPETDWRSMVQKSIAANNEGDIATAFSALEGAPAGIDDPRFYVYRASLLLSVGRVDEAKTDIDQALKLTPGNGFALALQSLIAVVGNDKQAALKLAMEAAEAEPNSVSVKIALSYADQANFKLDEALASVQQAVKIDPDASLAWARLAELWMAHGYLERALESANKAAALNPKEVRIQTVLGFAYLTEIKVDKAKEAFLRAIALNSADPMPRLGFGLALIREGNLEEGRKQIEIAASLDPNNSLIRSYLGKAYYEEKRDPQAQIQFQMAKELDPMDPTPYLYDAIQKQTINRPVEALHDLEKSIELNNNRAVYRSQLLLDSDQASRSVNLGRIYDDLGFQQAALVEGFKSVNIDPTNYSAHRFLSDSYATLPNSEVARASELLQAQLLQPLNNNPVQPSLDKSAPTLFGGAGPVDTSFNEYSQLFNRDQNQLLVSGIAGNQSSLGDEAIISGLQGRYSYSLSQLHYNSNGFRTNDSTNQNIYDIFSQISLAHNLSIQGEVRLNYKNNGYLALNFDPDLGSPTLDMDSKLKTYRLGMHYAPTPTSDFVISGIYQSDESNQNDMSSPPTPPSVGLGLITKNITRARTVEGQYLLQIPQISLITGGGYDAGPKNSDIDILFSGIPISEFEGDDHVRHTNVYLYPIIHFPVHLNVTLGASMDWFQGGLFVKFDRSQFNPKFGLTWNLAPSTTIRLAGLRTMRRDLVSNQTIEPTQVAGFQQFFQDSNDATASNFYGIGIDQKFSSDLYGGGEFTKRDLTIPVPNLDGSGTWYIDNESGTETKARAYLYWTPTAWAAPSIEYLFDNLLHLTPFADRVTTHFVPLGLNLYHPDGLFAKLKTTYVDQYGDFLETSSGTFGQGSSRFWIWDAAVGYRLPKRYGIFSLGANNIFDRNFEYQDIDNPLSIPDQAPNIQPARFIYAKLTLALN